MEGWAKARGMNDQFAVIDQNKEDNFEELYVSARSDRQHFGVSASSLNFGAVSGDVLRRMPWCEPKLGRRHLFGTLMVHPS